MSDEWEYFMNLAITRRKSLGMKSYLNSFLSTVLKRFQDFFPPMYNRDILLEEREKMKHKYKNTGGVYTSTGRIQKSIIYSNKFSIGGITFETSLLKYYEDASLYLFNVLYELKFYRQDEFFV